MSPRSVVVIDVADTRDWIKVYLVGPDRVSLWASGDFRIDQEGRKPGEINSSCAFIGRYQLNALVITHHESGDLFALNLFRKRKLIIRASEQFRVRREKLQSSPLSQESK